MSNAETDAGRPVDYILYSSFQATATEAPIRPPKVVSPYTADAMIPTYPRVHSINRPDTRPPEVEQVTHTLQFAWPDGQTEGTRERYKQSIGQSSRKRFADETDMTPDERESMRRVHGALTEIGEELGITDMQERLPDESQHHIFPDHAAYRDGIKERFQVSDEYAEDIADSEGFQTPEHGVIFKRTGNSEKDRYIMAHEGGHAIGYHEIRNVEGKYKVKSGYQNLRSVPSFGLTHGLTEATNDIYVCEGLVRAGYDFPDLSYRPLGVLMTGLVNETAMDHDEDPKVIAAGLVKGVLTMDRSGLKPIRESVGEYGMHLLKNMSGGLTTDGARYLAKEMGLFYVNGDLNRLDAGKPVKFYDWLQK